MIKESIIDLFKLDWNPINTPKVAAKKAAQDLQDIIIR